MTSGRDNSEMKAAPSRYGPGARVAVLLPLPLAAAYDYRVPDEMVLADGDFVNVPLGNRRADGVVWGEGEGEIDEKKLRDVASKLDCPSLPEISRRFIDWVAAYTLYPRGAVLKMSMSVRDALIPPKPVIAYALNSDMPAFRSTPARERVIAVLKEGPPRATTELAREAATGPGVVKGLYDTDVLIRVELPAMAGFPEPEWDKEGPRLSPEQEGAAAKLVADVETGGFQATVLDGVPGSGKTEVYFQAVAEALKQGRQVLVLLPEIALSAQWFARFRDRFGVDPGVWHSDLSGAQRRHTWRAVANGSAKVIVGARSALFLPYPDLGLIVIDEEHESAFKQEDGVIYNGRDMGVVRAHLGDFPVILASATPSLESVVNAEQGRYGLLHLPARHGGASLPDIQLADMIKEPPPRGRWLSPALAEAVSKTINDGEQVLLFLNRRGYAPLTLCRTCGHRFQCPRCTSWLVEHRLQGRLQCHHCGFNIPLPKKCPNCETEDSLVACGPGVERLAEEVELMLPGVRMAIAASDNIASPKAAAELVRRIEDHEIDVIIGTQIVAKGYHFPMLTLVGVVDGDLGLQGGDLRAAERTYQLLYQVAGRAGRAERPGRVIVQTYMQKHPVMSAILSGGKEAFLEAESRARQQISMPPFGKLVALIVSGPNEFSVDEAARELGRTAPTMDGVQVLGPAPAPFALLRGRHRRRLLMKAPKDMQVQPIIRRWLSHTDWHNSVRVQVDIDPMSFM
jgi:primosomal protein N' (replication factor Y) (superfamily II helicase)